MLALALQLQDATVQGLHRIVSHMWAGDYASCLAIVNELVSTGSFAVLSEFLPGVKMLVQVATQMNVYMDGAR